MSVGGLQQRALLILLVIHRAEVLSADAMVDALFEEASADTTLQRLQVAISRLRRALGSDPAGGPIRTQANGYRLELEAGALDADRYETALAEARSLVDRRQPGAAVEVLDAALALWEGRPLADVEFRSFAQAEIARLEELRLMGLELRVDAMLAVARHDEVLPELEALVRDHPLRERFRAQLMLSLYRAGRHADALETYQDGRRRLVDELGLEPGPELRRLHQAILEQAPELELRRSADAPEPALPAVIAELGERAFVGRRAAMQVIGECWQQAADGGRGLVFVSGEAGIGKSALAARAAQTARAGDATVLYGACDDEPTMPYQPFTESLRFLCGQRPDLVESLSIRDDVAAAGLLVPQLRGAVAPRQASQLAGPDAERYLLFDAVTAVLDHAIRAGPLLLVLDDLHWADRSTWLLLRHVVRHLSDGPVMVLGTLRPELPSDSARLLADLERHASVARVELQAFDESESGELVLAYAGGDAPSTAVIRQWHERTQGHPFFLHELLRHADAATLAVPPEGSAPRTVAELITQRLDRLDEAARSALAAAAVIGPEFRLDVLAAVLASSPDDTLALVEQANAAGLVTEVPETVDRFVFSHALVRAHLYAEHSHSRRARLHQRIAEAHELSPGASAGELANHLFEARALVGGERAMRACVAAGLVAADASAYDEAATYYGRAIEALELGEAGEDDRHGQLLLELGTLQWRAGDPAAETTFSRARESARRRGDATQLALAALAGRHHETGFRDEPRIALLEEALDALDDADGLLRVRVLARLTENLHFAAAEERALRLSAEALDVANRLGDPEALVAAQLARHAAHFHIEHLHERLEIMAELHRLARETGHPDLSGHALQWTIYAQLELGAVGDARDTLERLTILAGELREPRYAYIARTWRVTFALIDEAPEDAERFAVAAYELAPRVQGIDANAIAGAQMFFIRRAQGRLEEIMPALSSLVAEIPLLWGRAALTLALAETGRTEEASSTWESIVGAGLSSIPRDMWWLVTLATLAETCHRLADAPRAAALYDLLAPYAERNVQLVFTAHLGPLERHLGLLAATTGDHDRATAHLRAAVRRSQDAGLAGFARAAQSALDTTP